MTSPSFRRFLHAALLIIVNDHEFEVGSCHFSGRIKEGGVYVINLSIGPLAAHKTLTERHC